MSAELTLNTIVAYWDVDRDNLIGLPALFKFLQEVAIKHADQFDAGTKAMTMRGESWVLNRMAAAIHRYPRYEEPVRILTWSGGVRAFKGYRDFRIYCGDELVLSASSLWLYVNMRTKSLMRVPEEVARSFPSRPGEEFRPDLERLRLAPPAPGSAPAFRVSIRYSDFDGNGHVNNTTYFDILQTALSRSGLSTRPQSVEIQFLKEIHPEVEWVEVHLERRGQMLAFGIGVPDTMFAQGQVACAAPENGL